jgi:acetolactate synthase-1/2/3 large subunit
LKITGTEILLKSLLEEGVETIFGHPGAVMLRGTDPADNHPIKRILCRHEQVATHAAEGYYKATGRTGTVMVSSGSGVTNCVTALTDALVDSMAIVVLTGQFPAVMGWDAAQEADTVGTARGCTKHSFMVVTPEEIPRIIKEAYFIARSGRPGPVLVDLPQAVMTGSAAYKGHPKTVAIRGYNPQLAGHPGQIRRAAELIAQARHPVIYGGGGIIHADASEELRELVEITQIPTTLTLMGLGALPTSHPLWLGMLGMHGLYWANRCLIDADLIVAIGSRFDDRVMGKACELGRQCKIIHVDIDPTSIQKYVEVDVPIVGDVRWVLRELNKELRKVRRDWAKNFEEWHGQIEVWKKQHPLRYEQRQGVIKPQYAIDMILRLTEEYDPIIATGVGQHQVWAAQFYRGRMPRRWLTSGGLGTMGYGFPAALGAQAAFPNSLVLNIDGDGGIQASLSELSTLIDYKLPVKTFVINNRCFGMVRQWHEHASAHQPVPTDPMHQPDFVKLAEAYGVVGIRIERPEEVKAGIEKAISTPGPVVVDVVVEREENCLPTIPAGAAITDIVRTPTPIPDKSSQAWH